MALSPPISNMNPTVCVVILSLLFIETQASATSKYLFDTEKMLPPHQALQNIQTTTYSPLLKRHKRTIVPTGYKTCPKGFVLVDGLFQCIRKQPNAGFTFSQTQRPNRATFQLPFTTNSYRESRTTTSSPVLELQPQPAALRRSTTRLPDTTTTSLPDTTTTSLPVTIQHDETRRVFTTETNSIYAFEDERRTSEVMSTQVTSESYESRYELLSSRKSKEIPDHSTPFVTETTTSPNTPTTSAINFVTELAESPIPEVDQAFIKLRELRLHATTSHRNCKHPYELRLFRDGETIDDDYD
ncbi:unnamed protein product [Orchesella dallaii]|uniref:Uncharacterized protein n=1 Tax=Orchesella dallaii TaxID=48710 RepID=A0ABP1PZ55_9HEXA